MPLDFPSYTCMYNLMGWSLTLTLANCKHHQDTIGKIILTAETLLKAIINLFLGGFKDLRHGNKLDLLVVYMDEIWTCLT